LGGRIVGGVHQEDSRIRIPLSLKEKVFPENETPNKKKNQGGKGNKAQKRGKFCIRGGKKKTSQAGKERD